MNAFKESILLQICLELLLDLAIPYWEVIFVVSTEIRFFFFLLPQASNNNKNAHIHTHTNVAWIVTHSLKCFHLYEITVWCSGPDLGSEIPSTLFRRNRNNPYNKLQNCSLILYWSQVFTSSVLCTRNCLQMCKSWAGKSTESWEKRTVLQGLWRESNFCCSLLTAVNLLSFLPLLSFYTFQTVFGPPYKLFLAETSASALRRKPEAVRQEHGPFPQE